MTATTKVTSVLLGAAICLLFLTGTPSPSYACTCLPRTHEEYFNDAAAVFAGQVVNIDKLEDYDYELTFSVSQYWKGLSENDRFVTAQGRINSGFCGFPFQEGGEYLTYAYRNGDGSYDVGGCMGTTRMADADYSLTVLGSGVVPNDVIFVGSDPLDGLVPVNAMSTAPEPDWALVFIATAIGILSAGLAVLIIRKPKR